MIQITESAAEKIQSLEVFECHGATLVIDRKSHLFLRGTTLDYDTALLLRGFVFHNPNAKQTCGCGSSFGA